MAEVINFYDSIQSPAPITIAPGDGIGPEIMDATLRCVKAAGAQLAIKQIDIGRRMYDAGFKTGIHPDGWQTLRETGVFLRGPVSYPEHGFYETLNVALRRYLDMYANVRWAVSRSPFVTTQQPKMDVVVIRDNLEDVYTGIEHRLTSDVCHGLKMISRSAAENIIRFAFEFAVANNRKKVSCFTKDHVLPITDGLFHEVFDDIGQDFPEIETDHWNVATGTARLAIAPGQFDVIVTSSMYGSIVSETAVAICSSPAIPVSTNYGEHFSMFAANHGSAPDISGKGTANPSGLLLAAMFMLGHLNQCDAALRIHNAWLKTIEDGVHTDDIFRPGISSERVGTQDFADAVIERIGRIPEHLKPASSFARRVPTIVAKNSSSHSPVQELVGIDLYIKHDQIKPQELANRLITMTAGVSLDLIMILNRGNNVWPLSFRETLLTDEWFCRFKFANKHSNSYDMACQFMQVLTANGLHITKTENLYTFDGHPGFCTKDWSDLESSVRPTALRSAT
ncbi:NADP-dependent isocitrate dehydrogenase [Roseibium sp. RKSG952]|uniref:NADP-dependent isocitrate dehydrogenase n=1 Tax=Roseibium sp. RKSG952 TaxID=2529384 RepID=UPI0012BC347F|nr:NADP-dependent isocitrate dehydrogenase [Roseibium sp. RKSG952]MTH94823.1 NADP-dependent isocitrate dehydrogenase [Roseibium sp. RKSG952]